MAGEFRSFRAGVDSVLGIGSRTGEAGEQTLTETEFRGTWPWFSESEFRIGAAVAFMSEPHANCAVFEIGKLFNKPTTDQIYSKVKPE
ncbi:hypothetical protein QEH59_14665 [Coraliomargarita sp. SDUM461004]|uniref:Uncharacterized protein n=1 Tax=Thalassobacterium sedimentorum TaxID=3041258 RepID=A0ABU1ALR2_9BACT|nr:hypothetical protein [Coraliomargarita sp. SDUM461004]MDQ8195674.1 hypothetical protein [Coraliomargarita sp. SDUM461004]